MLKVCGFLFAATMFGRAAESPPKELVTYIQNAKQLGLTDEQIRRNAATAGWAPDIIDDAFVANGRMNGAGQSPPPSNGNAALPDDYHIGPGDVLSVSVWKEPDASVPMVSVRADGKISLPLVKEIAVTGLTPAEVEQILAVKLSRYINGVDVTVIVNQINSRKIYVVGGLKTVGTIDLKGSMTVLQAITQSGGLTDYAKRKQIYVLRSENGRQVRLPFNYDAVIKGEKMEQNIVLSPNDTIVVPQ